MHEPTPPTGARLIAPDGKVTPLTLTYAGRNADLIHVWTTDVVPAPGSHIAVEVLPPMTAINVPLPVDPALAAYLPNVGRMIRSNHPASYRRGEWALILAAAMILPPSGSDDLSPVYRVSWPDGAPDVWAVEDPAARYEYRDATPADLAKCTTRIDCHAGSHHPDCPKGRGQ